MGELFALKVGDTAPGLEATLRDSTGDAVDLSDATVDFNVLSPRGGDVEFAGSASIVDAPAGQVEYHWGDGDTGVKGRYRAEFVVTYVDDSVETFPNDGFHDVVITQ